MIMMVHLSAWLTLVIISLVLLLAVYIQLSAARISWGSGIQGLLFYLLSVYLTESENIVSTQNMAEMEDRDLNIFGVGNSFLKKIPGVEKGFDMGWKPNLITFLGEVSEIKGVIALMEQLRTKGGIAIFVEIITMRAIEEEAKGHLQLLEEEEAGEVWEHVQAQILARRRALLKSLDLGPSVFTKLFVAEDREEAEKTIIQTAGLGDLRPNVLFVVWPDWLHGEEKMEKVMKIERLWSVLRVNSMSMLLCKNLIDVCLICHSRNELIWFSSLRQAI